MTDQNATSQPAPGWYPAQGDPPGTQRYWDGTQWQGGPQPVPGPVASSPSGFATGDPFPSTLPGRPAEFGSRAIALIIDSAIALAIYVAAFVVAAVLGAVSEPLGAVAFVLVVLGMVGFTVWNHVILQGSTGQTLGKRRQRIKLVADSTGQPVGVGMTLVRYLVATALSSFTCGVGGILDYLWPLWDDDNKRLTDKVLKFSVITTG